MSDIDKTKKQLIKELVELRERFTQCMVSETECGSLLEQLRDSEERYRMVFESANDVIFLIDKNGKILDVNEKVHQLTGYRKEDFVGQNIRKLTKITTAKSLVLIMKNFMKRMAGMHVPPYEIEVIKKGGTLSYGEINAVAIKKDGKIIGDLAVVRDVTERKRAEKDIQRKADDMFLINLLNQAINRGDNLQKILHLLSNETKRIFSCDGVTLYLLDEDKKHLILQTDGIHSKKVKRRVEEIIGMKIPADIKIPLKEGSLYQKALQKGKPQLINDPATIQSFIAEFTENKMLKKLVPKIYRILGIESLINIPLISGHEVIGLMDVSSNEPFTELALQRFMIISEQLTTIIKRKRAEEALQKSENEKTLILSSVSELVNYQDKELKIVWANRPAAESVGLSLDQLVGHYCYEIWHQRSEPCVGCPIGKTIETGQPQQGETTTPDGRVWFIRGYPVRDENNNVVGAVEVTMDITERKRVEEELRKSEKRFRDISDAALTWIWEVDAKGKYIYVSPIVKKILGYTPKEILGRHFYDLFSREERQALKKAAFEVFAKKQPFREFINRNVHKNGHIVWLSTTAVPILNEKGDLLGYRGADADITERKFAEEALQDSEEKYRAAVERSADNIYLLDVESKKILETNAALQKLLGYSAEEMRKLTVYDFVAHSKEDINQKIKKIIKVKRSFVGERKYRRKDGSIVEVEVSANFLILKGKKALYVVSRDITERKRVEKALRESEEKYKTLTENINVGIYRNTVGPKGKFIEANPAIVKMFGYDNKYDFLAINVADLYQYPRDRARFNKKMLQQGFVHNEELLLKRKDGLPFIGSVSAVAIKDEYGKVTYYDGIVEDITERKQFEEALLESEQKFRGLYESVRDGIIMVDMEGTIVDCNNSFLNMLGYTQKEVVELTYQGVTPIRYHKYEESIVNKQVLARGFSDEYEKEFIKKDGTKRSVTVTRWVVRNEQGDPIGMWSIVRDITERQRHEAELEHMATHDILTGLPNRMLFKDRLEQALKHAQRKGLQLAVMLLDLDQFKEINDSLGHSVGDKLLQHVGERLSSVLRKGDTVARMGGDEFMLLLPEITHVSDSSTIAQKILIAVRTPMKIEQHQLHITTSIGIAVYPLDGLDADTLMKNADIAMYWAKDKGRNDYQRYDQTMNAKKNPH